ncbi:Carbohydrate esterase 4 protein [Mortierella hygrophila]|uniref:Carbohydrate esterase 4 protein n=1 Tax=Mortierella hygrophila TaxID=979708 RepID=A0A9P6K8K6_9FUNG|nr:Carbohydrate esterase 4 protein [Mortierella hygrophila]
MAPIARIAMAVLLFSATFINAAPAPTNADNDAHMVGFSRAVSAADTGVKLVYKCTVPNTMAITFDDGPFNYTLDLVKLFNKKKAKATFFINGDNNGKITDYTAGVKQAYLDGHQIASHTWDHKDLATLSVSQINTEMSKLDTAIKKIIGVSPTYMRPPYGSINDRVTKTVGAKYTIVIWNQDTNDWQHENNWEKSYKVYTDKIKKANGKAGDIILQHETIKLTAKELAPRAIDYAQSMGWKLVTVGECLGKPKSTWYRK